MVPVRLEKSDFDRIKEIAIEGNVSQWIRLLIRRELELKVNDQNKSEPF